MPYLWLTDLDADLGGPKTIADPNPYTVFFLPVLSVLDLCYLRKIKKPVEETKIKNIIILQRVFRGRIQAEEDLLLKYKDEDGDLITITDK